VTRFVIGFRECGVLWLPGGFTFRKILLYSGLILISGEIVVAGVKIACPWLPGMWRSLVAGWFHFSENIAIFGLNLGFRVDCCCRGENSSNVDSPPSSTAHRKVDRNTGLPGILQVIEPNQSKRQFRLQFRFRAILYLMGNYGKKSTHEAPQEIEMLNLNIFVLSLQVLGTRRDLGVNDSQI